MLTCGVLSGRPAPAPRDPRFAVPPSAQPSPPPLPLLPLPPTAWQCVAKGSATTAGTLLGYAKTILGSTAGTFWTTNCGDVDYSERPVFLFWLERFFSFVGGCMSGGDVDYSERGACFVFFFFPPFVRTARASGPLPSRPPLLTCPAVCPLLPLPQTLTASPACRPTAPTLPAP